MNTTAWDKVLAGIVGLVLIAYCCVGYGQQGPGGKKSIQCFPADSPRRIDGQLNEWQEEVPLTMQDPAVKLWTAWDHDHLYIACQAPRPGGGRRGIGSLSLFLDLRGENQRNEVYRRGVYHVQLTVNPAQANEDVLRERAKTGFRLAETDDPTAHRLVWKELGWTGVNETAVAGAATAEGDLINLEVRFPWTTFPLAEGKAFDPQPAIPSVFTLDWSVGRPGAGPLFWAGSYRNIHDPSGLADVRLLSGAEDFSQERFDRESTPGPGPVPAAEKVASRSLKSFSSPTSYTQGTPAKIDVMVAEPAGFRTSPFIYGQFSEHFANGWPMSRAVWAQVLVNPSFEAGHPRFDYPLNPYQLMLAGHTPRLLSRWSPKYKSSENARAVAPPWVIIGDSQSVRTEDNALNSEQCQKLTRHESGETGVGQVVRIPIDREQTYHLAFYARSAAPTTLTASVRDAQKILTATEVKVEGSDWQKYEATLRMPSGLDPGAKRFFFALTISEGGPVWIDYANLVPADHVEGFCPEILKVFRELKPHHIRYPGGNFASGYHWRDGVGPREKRPTRLNVAWLALEPNEVGTDEFLRFCELVGMKVMMCANFGSGTPEEAADWVEYCNGAADTPLGKLRAANGHPEPYDVIDWDIGNEVFGHWQIGHCPPDEYARGVVRFGEAMRRRDPRIRIAACGYGPFNDIGRDWNNALYEIAGDRIDIMTFHTYIPPLPPWITSDPVQRMRTVLSHPHYYEQSIREMAQRMTAAGMENPQIAVTEYNLNPRQVKSPRLDRTVHLLWYAQMAHVWMRAGEIVPLCHITEMTPFDVPFRQFGATSPRFEVFKLYAHQAGDRPVLAKVTCPTYDVKNVAGQFVPLSDVPIIDAVALVGDADGGRFLSLLAINKELKDTVKLHVELHDFVPAPDGVLYVIRDPDPAGEPGAMPKLQTQETELEAGGSFAYDLPPCSVTLLRVREAP